MPMSMQEFEKRSGVAQDHVEALRRVCAERKVFLFLRPTDPASTRLIKEGYATKSMDIHHKSSNWGPMAGMVPVDPAFNKVFGVTQQNPNPAEPLPQPLAHAHNHPHGASAAVQLALSDKLLNDFSQGQDAPLRRVSGDDTQRVYASTSSKPRATQFLFPVVRREGAWDVFWSLQGSTERHPLFVFAYQTGEGPKPITGDYDTWMISPHMVWWKLHTHVLKVEDEHGGSAATLFNAWFIEELNKACGRSDNPVFNHGAEQQNYGFTQKLDDELAMFTPGGTYDMVKIEQMPRIMAELMGQQYLVLWNKRYTEVDPRLMNEALKPEQKAVFEQWKTQRQQPQSSLEADAKKASPDGFRIHAFHDALERLMKEATGQPVLGPEQLGEPLEGGSARVPTGWTQVTRVNGRRTQTPELRDVSTPEQRKLQRELQQHIVQATSRGGESDLGALEQWSFKHVAALEKLSAAFGQVPGKLPQQDLTFLLQRGDEGDAFMRRLPKPPSLPGGTKWSKRWGMVVCTQCKKSVKLPNTACLSHPALLDGQGQVCCKSRHPAHAASPQCGAVLCTVLRREGG